MKTCNARRERWRLYEIRASTRHLVGATERILVRCQALQSAAFTRVDYALRASKRA
jgi:hypothetical protein